MDLKSRAQSISAYPFLRKRQAGGGAKRRSWFLKVSVRSRAPVRDVRPLGATMHTDRANVKSSFARQQVGNAPCSSYSVNCRASQPYRSIETSTNRVFFCAPLSILVITRRRPAANRNNPDQYCSRVV